MAIETERKNEHEQSRFNSTIIVTSIAGAVVVLIIQLLFTVFTNRNIEIEATTLATSSVTFVIIALCGLMLKKRALRLKQPASPNKNKPAIITTTKPKKDAGQELNLETIKSSFDKTKLGLVFIGPNQKIIYANEIGRSVVDKNGDITLYFDGEAGLTDWLEDVRENKIRAYRSWQRVSNSQVATEERKFYDLEVNFCRNEAIETIVLLLDRTKKYSHEEEDFDFIAFATHELRGPITVIRGYLEILQREVYHSVDSEHQQILNRLVVSANRLSGYINNILSVSKYDRRHLQVFVHEETIGDVIDSIYDDVSLRASTQNRLLTFEVAPDLPTIAVDKSSIGEVLVNLIDNAIKYSHEGGSILVRAYQKGDYVEVAVTDNGIGMPSNVINNLFKKFYRSHRSRESVAGTGIGLYLSKAIVESHGGYIGVISEVGEGSTFTFGVPIHATVADKLKESSGQNQALIRQQSDGWIKNHGMYKS